MPVHEVELWAEYRRRYGFASDRIVYTLACVGSALVRAWGSKAKPEDLIPRFHKDPLTQSELRTAIVAMAEGEGTPISKEEYQRLREAAYGIKRDS